MGDIVAWIAAGVAFVSLVVSILTFIWNGIHDRKQATLEAVNRLQAEVFDKIYRCPLSVIKECCADNRGEKFKEITGYLSRINHFAVGVHQKIYDKKTFYELTHGYFDGENMKEKLFYIIKNKNHKRSEKYYEATVQLLAWMDKRKLRHNKRAERKEQFAKIFRRDGT